MTFTGCHSLSQAGRLTSAVSASACLLVLFSFCALQLHAALPTQPNYFTRRWQKTDGLPDNNVTSVIQTRDGYIWLGTRGGLARFDGHHFTVFDGSNTPEMQSRHVTSLFEGIDGTLWIGHESGEVTSYRDGSFHEVPTPANWRGGKIFGISSDSAGDVWLLNADGELARIRDGKVIPPPPETVTHLLALTKAAGGDLWVQRDNEVSVVKDGRLTHEVFDAPPTNRYVQGIGAARDGGMWVMFESLMQKWNHSKWTQFGSAPWLYAPTHTLLETRQGILAAATVDHGLYLIFPGGQHLQFSRANGFPSDWVTSLCEDREGNLWAGTANGGIAMVRQVNITALSPPDESQGRAVLSIAAGPDGSLWLGTEGAGIYRYLDGNWSTFDELSGLAHRYVWSMVFDAHDRLWAGTWGGGIFVQSGSHFERPTDLPNNSIGALLGSRRGGLVVGTSTGLMRFDGGKSEWLGGKPEIASADIRAIKEADDGTIWFGMSGGGLGCYQDGKLRQFRRSDGLSSDFVQCLYIDSDHTLWIGTSGGGINRLKDGHFVVLTKDNGLPSDVICDIEDDCLGHFWISSHAGITRVSKAELNRCADEVNGKLHCLTYGLSDGLPTLECSGGSQPAGCRTADGRVWFSTAKGIVGVDPTNVRTNHLVPPVAIETMRVDGHSVEGLNKSNATIRLAPGRHRLEIDYAAMSFMAPERVNFKYRLEGWDKEWIDAGTQRVAPYNYDQPGDYVFRVVACNNDGIWNDTGASLAFTVLPFFWQTWWFRSLAATMAAVSVGGVVLVVTRGRMRRKLERIERQQALERERARIAKDIHDDLGASLTRISLLTQSTRADLSDPSKAAIQLDRIYGTARELTRAMDEIVWAVNPQHDTLDSLANYLGKYAQDYLRAAGVRCKLDVPVQLPPWPLSAEVRHNVFLAFKESLHNVVKHAAAVSVRIVLELRTHGFALCVEDNGRGFDPDGVARERSADPDRVEHGNGLLNMKRRLAEIGGSCEIQSSPQEGTTVKFEVPVKPA